MRPWILFALLVGCDGKTLDPSEDGDGDGFSVDDGDCDDTDASISPNAEETCGSVDNDCDGLIGDDDPDAGTPWYADADGDGFGDDADTVTACNSPGDDWTDVGGDCVPLDGDAFPGADERCNGIDDDCNDLVDDDLPDVFTDADRDGYGDATAPLDGCEVSDGRVDNDEDCDDTNADLNPDTVWYFDSDLDGYGVSDLTEMSCTSPGGDYSLVDGDCRPLDVNGYPGADEICDNGQQPQNIDDNCNGFVDEGCGIVHDCDPITEDTTWIGTVLVPCDVVVGGDDDPTLTISDSSTLLFAPEAAIKVGGLASGSLVVNGGGLGVVFTSDEPNPEAGDWVGLVIDTNTGSADVNGLTIQYAGFDGSGAVRVRDGEPDFDGLIIEDTEGVALSLQGGDTVIQDLEIDTASGTGIECGVSADAAITHASVDGTALAMETDVDCADALRGLVELTDNTVNEVVVSGLRLGETASWSDVGVPYRLTQGIAVGDSETLIEWVVAPGVDVLIDAGGGIRVGAAGMGTMTAVGTVDAPITFRSGAGLAAAGDWEGIAFQGQEGDNTLAHVQIAHTGASSVLSAGIYINGSGADVVASNLLVEDGAEDGITVWDGSLTLTDSVVQNHIGSGLVVNSFGDLVDEVTGSTFTGNASPALFTNANAVHFLSETSTYTGNVLDAIVVEDLAMDEDSVWVDLGVPYRLENGLLVAADGGMSWSIDTAVVEVGDGETISIGLTASSTASLVADSVTFTSVGNSAAAADRWSGLANRGDLTLSDSTVRYGGTSSSAALEVFGGTAIIDGNTFESAEGTGIRCWIGATISSLTGNTFIDVGTDTDGCDP